MDNTDQEYQKVEQQGYAVIAVESVEPSSVGVEHNASGAPGNQANTQTAGGDNLALGNEFIRSSLFV